MKKEKDNKKATVGVWMEKTASMAAVVAALGISLGVNVQQVYSAENIQIQERDQKLTTQQGKIDSRQGKVTSKQHKIQSQQLKIDATQHKAEVK